MAATRLVQDVVTYPGTDLPVVGAPMQIRLNTPAFVDAGATELSIRPLWPPPLTDATGLWQARLYVNSDPDMQPAETSYTVRSGRLPGVVWTFQVLAGDPDVPVNLFDCLVDAPTNPTPIQSFDAALDALFANTVTA